MILFTPLYLGRARSIYSAQRYGRAHDLVDLELEVRQDLIDTSEKALATARRIARALEHDAPEETDRGDRPSAS